jgi:hypothetical protein
MRAHLCCLLTSTCLLAGALPAFAQTETTPMSALEISLACSAPASLARPAATTPRVIGSQDTMARTLFGPRELLVVNSGLASGMQLNQRFFVRRENRFGTAYGQNTLTSRTLGWIRIVAVDNSTAIATVEHSCDGMMAMDYLEPFVAPAVPTEAVSDTNAKRGEPDFSVLTRVLAGNDDRRTSAPGDFVMIETGVGSSLTPGTSLAIYRYVRVPGLPLASVGDAVVVSVGENVALARIMRARDAVQTGDYMAVRK